MEVIPSLKGVHQSWGRSQLLPFAVHPSCLRPIEDELVDAEMLAFDNASDIVWADVWKKVFAAPGWIACLLPSGKLRLKKHR